MLTLQRQLVDFVDVEFEGAVLFAALMDWHDYEEASTGRRARGILW